MMDVGDPAGDRILDRDHAELGACRPAARRTRPRRSRRASGSMIGIDVEAGDVRIGARFALVGDRSWSVMSFLSAPAFRGRARRSSGVSTPSGTTSTSATSMRMPASSARNCSSLSRCSSGEGGSATKRCKRGAAIGVEADVVQQRRPRPRARSAGEIERAQPAGRRSALPTALTTLGSSRSSARRDFGVASVAMSTVRIGERPERGAHAWRARSSAGRPGR